MKLTAKKICCVLFPLVMGIAACSANHKTDDIDLRSVLEPLIEKNVIPELENSNFIRRPTFIRAGKIDGTAESVGRIDDVTQMIRKLIILKMAGKPGIFLVQRHSLPEIKNQVGRVLPQQLQNECQRFTEPEYYLVIDAYASGRTVYVDMIAQGVEGGNIASGSAGFKVSFNFKADQGTIDSLKQKDWDEYLQGTKYYPIDNDGDGIAAYLAYDLICILGNTRYDRRDAGFYIDSSGLGPYEKQICDTHLKNYLIKFGLPVAEKAEQATHIIVPSTAAASGGDFALWARVASREDGRSVGGAASRVYYKPGPVR